MIERPKRGRVATLVDLILCLMILAAVAMLGFLCGALKQASEHPEGCKLSDATNAVAVIRPGGSVILFIRSHENNWARIDTDESFADLWRK